MTELSPAAQAIDIAIYGPGLGATRRQIAAAALRAAVDQVVPEEGDPIYGLTPTGADRQVVRRKFLAIATELGAMP
jgi:hypothetical protein